MASKMHRAQILMETEQHRLLAKIAKRQKRSVSDVAREAIALGLAAMGQNGKAEKRRRFQAVRRLNQLREKTQRKHGLYPGNPLAEARAERERQLEAAWRAS